MTHADAHCRRRPTHHRRTGIEKGPFPRVGKRASDLAVGVAGFEPTTSSSRTKQWPQVRNSPGALTWRKFRRLSQRSAQFRKIMTHGRRTDYRGPHYARLLADALRRRDRRRAQRAAR